MNIITKTMLSHFGILPVDFGHDLWNSINWFIFDILMTWDRSLAHLKNRSAPNMWYRIMEIVWKDDQKHDPHTVTAHVFYVAQGTPNQQLPLGLRPRNFLRFKLKMFENENVDLGYMCYCMYVFRFTDYFKNSKSSSTRTFAHSSTQNTHFHINISS